MANPTYHERKFRALIHRLIYVCLIGVLVLANSGCASIHEHGYAVQVDRADGKSRDKRTQLGLIVSGAEGGELSSTYFGVIFFTFENQSQEWIRVKRVKVEFGHDKINKNTKFTSGKDLAIWRKSIDKRSMIRDANSKMILSAITGLGAGLALSSDRDVRRVGAMTAIAGATSLSVYEFNKTMAKIEKPQIFPENHLFARDFIIPPGLFVKKWLVINSKNHEDIGYISQLFIEYQTEDGKIEKLALNFRPRLAAGSHYSGPELFSEWQQDLR